MIAKCSLPVLFILPIEILSKGCKDNKSVHVINFEIKDNHEDAASGAKEILQLALKVTLIHVALNLANTCIV